MILCIAASIDRPSDTTGTSHDADTRAKIEATRNSAKVIHKSRTKTGVAAFTDEVNAKVDIATKTEDNTILTDVVTKE